ncbi:MAG: reverse gyrase [Thermosulfidibacteraceae bacterium]|jgi:reverse gyrase
MLISTDKEKLAYFENFCPNCGCIIDNVKLENGLVCDNCLRENTIEEKLCKILKEPLFLREFCIAEEKLRDFLLFFEKLVGSEPWSLQITWAKRFFLGKSFAIQAPTGIGKTTFGAVLALFIQGKSYLIFPTKLLSKQVYTKIEEFKKKVKSKKKILLYTGKKSEKEDIETGNFDILITTNMFLHKNREIIKDIEFSLVFVDDVDSILKSSKNIDNLFKLLKLTDEDIITSMENNDPEKLKAIKEKIKGQLIVSSATLKPKTKKINLFRNLLGFDVQQSVSTYREIRDFYKECNSWDEVKKNLLEVVKTLGKGCLAYVPIDKGKQAVEEIVEFLKKNKINAISYENFEKNIEEFKKGKIKVAVGISTSSNALVRGIDLPQHVRYTVFLDVPKHVFPITPDYNITKLITMLKILANIDKENKEKILFYISYLKKYETIKKENLEKYPKIKEKVEEVISFITEEFKSDRIIEAIKKDNTISLKVDETGTLNIIIGDAISYLQASGRASRMLLGGFTKGISVILAYNKKALNSLIKRVRYLLPIETKIERIENLKELSKFKDEIDDSRDPEKIRKKPKKEVIRSVLTIVESPNKARTISNFFGKPQRRWLNGIISYEVSLGNMYLIVAASVGHIADLITTEASDRLFFGVKIEDSKFLPIYSTIKKCKNCNEQTADKTCHKCKVSDLLDKIDVINALRELAFESDEIYIATDPDAEGEKISWDLYLALKPFNQSVYRIEFHEVTPLAFKKALEEKRDIDRNRVKAQIVRRIADRWVGFVFSQKLQETFKKKNLSAGRVQTPVLGWIIERTEEMNKKIGKITLYISDLPVTMEIEDIEKAQVIFKYAENAVIEILERREDTINPPPPYTTSDLLKDAVDKLRLSTEETMKLAQELFELGYITYHRTDSTRTSPVGIAIAREYIESKYPGLFKGRSWGEGGAHECIRPTKVLPSEELEILVNAQEIELNRKAIKLYGLIFNRFMASMMKEVKVIKTKIKIKILDFTHEEEFIEEILSDGFNLITPIKSYKITDKLTITDKKLQIAPKNWPYTEGTIIEEMKKRGLGRPSTYAKIVQTLFERHYIVKKGNFVYPTGIGKKIFEHLKRYHPYTSEEFTRILEEDMDLVEHGSADYQEILWKIYDVRRYLEEKN